MASARRAVGLLALAAVALGGGPLLAAGCGSSAAPAAAACNEDPFQCAAGQTCWPQQCTCPPSTASCDPGDCTPQFACVAAAGASAGDRCQLTIGQVTCGALETCVDLGDGGAGGACRAYCDPDDARHGCPAGYQCVQLGVGQATAVEHVCLPAPPDEDASLSVDAPAPSGDDGGEYDPDALPVQPDAMADTGQHAM